MDSKQQQQSIDELLEGLAQEKSDNVHSIKRRFEHVEEAECETFVSLEPRDRARHEPKFGTRDKPRW